MVEKDDPETYLESFECLVTVAGWDMSWWAPQLGPLLTGWVQATYCTFFCTEPLDYQTVKDAILYHLEISPKHYRQKFWAKRGKEQWQPTAEGYGKPEESCIG